MAKSLHVISHSFHNVSRTLRSFCPCSPSGMDCRAHALFIPAVRPEHRRQTARYSSSPRHDQISFCYRNLTEMRRHTRVIYMLLCGSRYDSVVVLYRPKCLSSGAIYENRIVVANRSSKTPPVHASKWTLYGRRALWHDWRVIYFLYKQRMGKDPKLYFEIRTLVV